MQIHYKDFIQKTITEYTEFMTDYTVLNNYKIIDHFINNLLRLHFSKCTYNCLFYNWYIIILNIKIKNQYTFVYRSNK